MYTCPKYCTNLIDEPFKFSKELKKFKPPVVYDNKWHDYEP